jgi:hypothetical protein
MTAQSEATDYAALRRTARIAGLWYLGVTVFSIIGLLYVPGQLIVKDDAAATASNIVASEWLFRLGIFCVLVGQILHIPTVLELFNLFKGVNRKQAMLMVALVVAAVAIMFLVTLNQVAALIILDGPSYLSPLGPAQLNSLAMLFLDVYANGAIIIGFFWGLWLAPFGYLAYKSGFIPKILGVLLLVNCVAYVVDATAFLLLPGSYEALKGFTTILESLGEPLMLLWLLVFGIRIPKASSGEFAKAA